MLVLYKKMELDIDVGILARLFPSVVSRDLIDFVNALGLENNNCTSMLQYFFSIYHSFFLSLVFGHLFCHTQGHSLAQNKSDFGFFSFV